MYTPTIGIECHVQLKTLSKLFAPVDNDSRDRPPNTNVSHICFGMPGALPVLNEHAVELAARAAFALQTQPQPFMSFDRKHYFYPDLPKGYQITQHNHPIILGGSVDIELEGSNKKVAIERAHIEEDAGKNTHPDSGSYSLVDLNRAGTPLLEIVSAPDMHSPEEAGAYVRELYLLMRYADVSDGDMYHGNMRFDVNVSVSSSDSLGTRTETKNLNSFRSVERAVAYEIQRQVAILEQGGSITQETRGWDEAKQATFSQRSKEEAHDYRYFPEPDLPPFRISSDMATRIKEAMPNMPHQVRKKLIDQGVPADHVEVLIEAELDDIDNGYHSILLSKDVPQEKVKTIANLMVQVEVPSRKEQQNGYAPLESRIAAYIAVADLLDEDKLSSTNSKSLLHDLLFSGVQPKNIPAYAEQQGYIQVSDEGELLSIVKEVIAQNQKAADDVRDGEMKAIGFLVGSVMKASQGKANPTLAKELLLQELTSKDT